MQLTSEASSARQYTNGIASHNKSAVASNSITMDSDSDLSDVTDAPAPPTMPSSRNEDGRRIENGQSVDSSQDEDAVGSDDVDYAAEIDPPTVLVTHESRSTSEDSQRTSKRKATAEDDDYIMNNPELYGIRRSVRTLELSIAMPKLTLSRLAPVTRIAL